mgnify:CR=1 FL=1
MDFLYPCCLFQLSSVTIARLLLTRCFEILSCFISCFNSTMSLVIQLLFLVTETKYQCFLFRTKMGNHREKTSVPMHFVSAFFRNDCKIWLKRCFEILSCFISCFNSIMSLVIHLLFLVTETKYQWNLFCTKMGNHREKTSVPMHFVSAFFRNDCKIWLKRCFEKWHRRKTGVVYTRYQTLNYSASKLLMTKL